MHNRLFKVNFIRQILIAAFVVAAISFTGCKKDKDPDPVSLNNPTLELVEGGTATLTATVVPDDAENKAVTWKSDKPAVASIDAGKVTAAAEGTAVITVTTADGGKTAACKVTVTLPKVTPAAITGIDSPAVGNMPDLTAAAEQFTVTKIEWYDTNANLVTGPFAEGATYNARLFLLPKAGFTFEEMTNEEVKGFTVNTKPYTSLWWLNANGSLTITFPFDATGYAGTVITPAPVTGIYSPVSGNTSDMTDDDDSEQFEVTAISWTTNTDDDIGGTFSTKYGVRSAHHAETQRQLHLRGVWSG